MEKYDHSHTMGQRTGESYASRFTIDWMITSEEEKIVIIPLLFYGI